MALWRVYPLLCHRLAGRNLSSTFGQETLVTRPNQLVLLSAFGSVPTSVHYSKGCGHKKLGNCGLVVWV